MPACCQHLTATLLQASSGVKQWNKRWFVLVDRCLFYYKGTTFVGVVFASAHFCGCFCECFCFGRCLLFVAACFCGCLCFLQVFLLFAAACFFAGAHVYGCLPCGCSPCWGTEGLMPFARLLAAHSAQLSLAAEGEHELLSRLACRAAALLAGEGEATGRQRIATGGLLTMRACWVPPCL